jgi:hypothetical protein
LGALGVASPPEPLARDPRFRRLGLSALANMVGQTGEGVVLGWLALELTDSPLAVGVALAMRMVPLLLVGLPAGALADRVERVRAMRWSAAVMAGAAGGAGLLALTGVVAYWHLLALTFVVGAARAVNQAVRQGYAHDVVGRDRLVSGMARLALAARVGGLAGSLAVGALIAALGPGVGYLAAAAGYLVSAGVLPRPEPPRPLPPAGRPSLWANVAVLLRAVQAERTLALLLLLTAGAEIFGFSYMTVLPSLARDVLGVGPEGLGAMTGLRLLGGIGAILLVSALTPGRGTGLLFLVILAVFGGGLIALGAAGSFAGVLAILIVVDAMGALSDVLSQSLVLLAVSGELRSGAAGAWVVAVGTAPLGQLQIGALAAALGVGAALAVNGGALVLLAGLVGLSPRIRRL